MPFGIHKGKKLIDVPGKYLLWLYNEGNCFGEFQDYLEDNIEAFKNE